MSCALRSGLLHCVENRILRRGWLGHSAAVPQIGETGGFADQRCASVPVRRQPPISTVFYRAILLAFLVLCNFPVDANAANEGQADLDKATEAKLTATTLGDLAEVMRLCEAAVKKGLDEANTRFANNLLASAAAQRGETISAAVLDASPPDPRWPQFRRMALEDLEKSVRLSPEQPQALYLIARLNLLPGGDDKRAAEALDKCIALAQDQPPLVARALLLRSSLQKDPAKRIEDLDEAVRIAPREAGPLRARSLLYINMGKPEKALEDLKAALAIDPKDLSTYETRALLLFELGKYAEALTDIDKLAALTPDSVLPLTLRARVYAKQNNAKAALAELDKAVAMQPDNILVLLMRAEVYSNLDQNDKALADVDRVVQLRPQLQTARHFRAALLAQANKLDEAIGELKKVLEAAPKDVPTRLQLALFYSAQKKPRKALEIYNPILAEKPDNLLALRGRADALLAVGEHAPAIADYDKALKQDPNDVGVLNNLAWVLATSPNDALRNGKRAIELANRAGEKTEFKKAYILSTLAAAYAETGDFKSAVKWSQKALEVGEKDQKDDLAKELAAFKAGKPWRELLTSDEKEEPQSAPPKPPSKPEQKPPSKPVEKTSPPESDAPEDDPPESED